MGKGYYAGICRKSKAKIKQKDVWYNQEKNKKA